MKARATVLTLALCIAGAAVCFAADAFMGTWKLNEAKSKIGAGSPKNTTVVYEAAGDSVKVTTDGTDGDGKPSHGVWTGKFDGKDYPVTGSPDFDTLSVRHADAYTTNGTQKRMGKVVGTSKRTVSKDGKTLTLAGKLTNAKGEETATTLVYDRQ